VDFVTWLRAQRDRVGGWTCIAIGAVMVISAWFSISGTSVVSAQLTYIASGGIGGLFFLGAGFGLLIRGDLHDEWRKLDRLESALRGSPLTDPQEIRLDVGDKAGAAPTPQPVTPALMSSNGGSPLPAALGAGPVALASPVTSQYEAVLLGGVVGAGALLALGWFRVSGTTNFQSGLNGLTFGVFGLLLAAAIVVYHSRSMRYGISQRLGRLLSPVSTTSGEAPGTSAKLNGSGWYVVEGSARYHLAGCQALNTSLTTEHVTSARQLGDLEPCRLCDAG
jgi:hypothetical protein